MGKFIAMGGGFGGDDGNRLNRHIMELSGKDSPHFLQIPTPAFDQYDRGTHSDFFNYGCDVDLLCLSNDGMTEETVAEKIGNADIIYVPGGNLRYLSVMWKKSHADKYLREAFNRGAVLFGSSSGAMCWFREGWDDCGPENAPMFVPALDLAPYCMCPHYENEFWQGFTEAIKTRNISGIACENNAAICFIDDSRYILTAEGAKCWFFDAGDGFRKQELVNGSGLLKNL